MPPLHGTLGLTVYHVHKGQRAGLLGSATTQIAPHAAESWLALRSPSGASVGHVCVAMSLGELAVLPRREYSPLEQVRAAFAPDLTSLILHAALDDGGRWHDDD